MINEHLLLSPHPVLCVCSTMGVLSTVGGVQYRGGYHEYRGEYLEYRGGVQYRGGIS